MCRGRVWVLSVLVVEVSKTAVQEGAQNPRFVYLKLGHRTAQVYFEKNSGKEWKRCIKYLGILITNVPKTCNTYIYDTYNTMFFQLSNILPWCFLCYSECISILIQCSANWATRSSLFECLVFRN